MIRLTCGPSSLSPNNRARAAHGSLPAPAARGNGYALLVAMIFVTVMLISLTATLPRIYQEGQREREQEAIFRAEQYDRAIYLFHRTLGRYPNSVKELLSTTGVRYLRQAYPDPLSPNHRWRFIHATAGGIILDSIDQNTPPLGQNAGSPHGNGTGAGSSTFSASTTGASPFSSGLSGSTGAGSSFSSGFSGQAGQGSGFSTATSGGASSSGETPAAGQKPKVSADCQAPEGSVSSSEAQTGTLLGAVIVGIAPCNDKKSIRVLNKQDEYDKWEFLGTNYTPYQLPQTQGAQPSSSSPNSTFGQPQSSPGASQPGMQNNPSPNTPSQNPGGP